MITAPSLTGTLEIKKSSPHQVLLLKDQNQAKSGTVLPIIWLVMLNVSKKKAGVSIISDSQNTICLDDEFGGVGISLCGDLCLAPVHTMPASKHKLPPGTTARPPPPPQISTVSYSPCHKHSESPVHLPLLIAVEAGLKPFSPCQMCVAAPRVCFYPEPDRRRCLMLQSPKEGAWREEERREFSPLGGVGGVV